MSVRYLLVGVFILSGLVLGQEAVSLLRRRDMFSKEVLEIFAEEVRSVATNRQNAVRLQPSSKYLTKTHSYVRHVSDELWGRAPFKEVLKELPKLDAMFCLKAPEGVSATGYTGDFIFILPLEFMNFDNDDQFKFTMAHETAHHTLSHIPLYHALKIGEKSDAHKQAFILQIEKEADLAGVVVLQAQGADPFAAVDYFRKSLRVNSYSPEIKSLIEKRVEALEAHFKKNGYKRGKPSKSEELKAAQEEVRMLLELSEKNKANASGK